MFVELFNKRVESRVDFGGRREPVICYGLLRFRPRRLHGSHVRFIRATSCASRTAPVVLLHVHKRVVWRGLCHAAEPAAAEPFSAKAAAAGAQPPTDTSAPEPFAASAPAAKASAARWLIGS